MSKKGQESVRQKKCIYILHAFEKLNIFKFRRFGSVHKYLNQEIKFLTNTYLTNVVQHNDYSTYLKLNS